jgi:phosphoribosylformimino-5-aminoimidazole carboxamide ribotide isomerase
MRIIPVIDLKDGRVVRGQGGRRHEYRPIVSRLVPSSRPLEVAEAFRGRFGLEDLYVADLDAIAGARPMLALYAELRSRGFRLWVDAGVRGATTAEPLAAAGLEGVVVGLETVTGPAELEGLCRRWGGRIIFSLDLQAGQPLGNTSAWQAPDARSIAAQAVSGGVRRLILLDLARVGEGTGTGTEALCAQLAADHPELEVVAGGGVRNGQDLWRLKRCGVRAVLVASALHDGRLERADWESL